MGRVTTKLMPIRRSAYGRNYLKRENAFLYTVAVAVKSFLIRHVPVRRATSSLLLLFLFSFFFLSPNRILFCNVVVHFIAL